MSIEDLVQHFNNYYNGPVSQVYNTFFAEHWRCEERSGNKRCTNVSVAHSKGHQYQMDEGERYGIFITEGEFTATFNPPLFADMILQHLEEMEAPYNAHVHSKMLRSVGNWLLQISTHRSCLSCLSDNPEHILSCHHVLCNKCAYEFTLASVGTVAIGSNYLKINSCPFGCSRKKGEWPWSVSVKPSSAGVRVLSLDGYVNITLLRSNQISEVSSYT